MTREETLKGVNALSSNEALLLLLEAQQHLSWVGCNFSEALESNYGEKDEESQKSIKQIYSLMTEIDEILSRWLYVLLGLHFSTTVKE